jgi:hypothetical protein
LFPSAQAAIQARPAKTRDLSAQNGSDTSRDAIRRGPFSPGRQATSVKTRA